MRGSTVFVPLGVVVSAIGVRCSASSSPTRSSASRITLVILKITWESWRTVRDAEPGELDVVHEH